MADKPDDLKDVSELDKTNPDYFLVTIPDLDASQLYKLKFAWIYPDKTKSDWSLTKKIITASEPQPDAPEFISGDLYGGEGFLRITWNGNNYLGEPLTKIDRVEVFINDSNGLFGSGLKPAGSFKTAGTITIPCSAGNYTVWLKAVTATGIYSDPSSSLTTAVTAGEVIEAPTLPVGLSVATTAFGITVNWGGAYQDDDPFSGFKTIAVYATTNGSLGASTTTAFTSSALVANLSVTQTINRVNIGIDNLKQALGLSTSEAVYDADVYFYYLAYNKNNEPYQVSGVTTYTRISSVPLSPTKANLIDLENGLISIENLVAGNGQFTSWLRTGVSGGARIELNGGSSFLNGGNYVLPGLSVYSSGDTAIFRADLSGNVTFGGYTPADLDLLQETADSKIKVFRQSATPTAITAGDIWINTSDSTAGRNTIYVAAAIGANSISSGGWVVSKDLDLNDVLAKSDAFDLNGNINRAIQIPVPNGVAAGSIASVKTAYADGQTGWYIGWDGISPTSNPVVDIGSPTNYFRWNGSAVEVRGSITATSFESSHFDIAKGGSGISITSQVVNGSSPYDQLLMTNNGLQKLMLSTVTSGAVIWGPSMNSYISMVNSGAMNIVAGSASLLFTTGGQILVTSEVASSASALRNISAVATAPSTAVGGASGYTNGEVLLVLD